MLRRGLRISIANFAIIFIQAIASSYDLHTSDRSQYGSDKVFC
ncbi:hypothetical protein GXM_04009 [Nostoc sphaeroides CCNUC1]|uniref:Uncharacterized protein n=1 Tax=Nostoc sphaeroides CCNUC1 TaxID=2653204 RepID=A0A5P8W1D2_9NOSO|nr:hypothetical protein GXM_04009 [Nostoc sphaeroides CCNUC1]